MYHTTSVTDSQDCERACVRLFSAVNATPRLNVRDVFSSDFETIILYTILFSYEEGDAYSPDSRTPSEIITRPCLLCRQPLALPSHR